MLRRKPTRHRIGAVSFGRKTPRFNFLAIKEEIAAMHGLEIGLDENPRVITIANRERVAQRTAKDVKS